MLPVMVKKCNFIMIFIFIKIDCYKNKSVKLVNMHDETIN